MTKYLVVEDMRFMFEDTGAIEVAAEFDTPDEADEYISSHFNLVEWEGQIHRVYWVIKKEVA